MNIEEQAKWHIRTHIVTAQEVLMDIEGSLKSETADWPLLENRLWRVHNVLGKAWGIADKLSKLQSPPE